MASFKDGRRVFCRKETGYWALSYTILGGRARHKIVGPITWRIYSRNHSNNDELVPKLAFITTGQTANLSNNDNLRPPGF